MSQSILPPDLLGFGTPAVPVVAFEQLLAQDFEFAMSEASHFLEGRGRVHETLRRLTERLDKLGIPYAVVGGMALFAHGYQRFTDDIHLLVTREGLKSIHENLDGLGYVRPFEKSKNLRDAQSKVKIEFLLSGDFPGDGKPKPVAFPNPSDVGEILHGMPVLKLSKLIELKLASGMTAVDRAKDIGDVVELIKGLKIRRDLGNQLHPFVQGRFFELWDQMHSDASGRSYLRFFQGRELAGVASLEDLIAKLPSAKRELEELRAEGVVLDRARGTDEGICLLTTNRDVAEKYGFRPEDDFFDADTARGSTDSDG